MAREAPGGSFKGWGMQRKEGALRRCRVHGCARTDAAMRPQADEGRKKKGLAATYSPALLQYHRRESA